MRAVEFPPSTPHEVSFHGPLIVNLIPPWRSSSVATRSFSFPGQHADSIALTSLLRELRLEFLALTLLGSDTKGQHPPFLYINFSALV